MKKYKGYTLVEIMIAIVIVVISISMLFILFTSLFRSQITVTNERNVQHSLRTVSQEFDKNIEQSNAIYTLSSGRFNTKLNPGWDYIGLNADKTELKKFIYRRDGTHYEQILIPKQKGITYELSFSATSGVEKFVKYNLDVIENGKLNALKSVKGTVDAKSARAVVDMGNATSPAVIIAFKSQFDAGKSSGSKIMVNLVIDSSSAMTFDDKSTAATVTNSRIASLINTLTGASVGASGRIENETQKGVVDKLASIDNIYLRLIPYSYTANYPNYALNLSNEYKVVTHNLITGDRAYVGNREHNKYNLKTQLSDLKREIFGITPRGDRNTGDALRRLYNYIETDIRDGYLTYVIFITSGNNRGFTLQMGNPTMPYYLGNQYVTMLNANSNQLARANPTSAYAFRTRARFNRNEFHRIYTGWGNRQDRATKQTYRQIWEKKFDQYSDEYVNKVGEEYKKRNLAFKSYIVGHSKVVSDNEDLELIRTALNAESKYLYKLSDPDKDIHKVFEMILRDMESDTKNTP